MNILGRDISIEIIYVLAIIFGVLIVCSVSFWAIARTRSTPLIKELIVRTRSWWYMAIGIAVVVTTPPIIGTVLIGYVSFVALREMLSIARFRTADRTAMFAAYFAIPVQFYLAYHLYYYQFLYFIPLIMFIGLPFILVMTGKTSMIGRSMSLIPTILLLTVYMISHIVLLFHVEVPGFDVGPGGLVIYLIMCTAFNDVFQFTWGKLLGKRKILPNVSPNKTWEGFIGGVLTTACLGYFLRFLTPLSGQEAFITGLAIGIMGFVGDSVVSAIKRDLEIKDTDDLIPGHGGAMDRLDSIVITAPVFYHFLRYFIEH
jgi:phosphatidate cytidylyltransferase